MVGNHLNIDHMTELLYFCAAVDICNLHGVAKPLGLGRICVESLSPGLCFLHFLGPVYENWAVCILRFSNGQACEAARSKWRKPAGSFLVCKIP